MVQKETLPRPVSWSVADDALQAMAFGELSPRFHTAWKVGSTQRAQPVTEEREKHERKNAGPSYQSGNLAPRMP